MKLGVDLDLATIASHTIVIIRQRTLTSQLRQATSINITNMNNQTTNPTNEDVINGRGQGVQRHPGNEKYRKLVHIMRIAYAKSKNSDKSRISKSIVMAFRQTGGRFLELDERTGIYYDIGDKKACAKTSQALREGLKKIRQMIQRDYNGSIPMKSISLQAYFEYSVGRLESMYRDEEVPSIVSPYLPPRANVVMEDRQIDSLPPLPNIEAESMTLLAATILEL